MGEVGEDGMTADDHLPRNLYLLRLSGLSPSRVHHLAVEIGHPPDLGHLHLEDADLGHQIDVPLPTEEEEVAAEDKVRTVEPVGHLPLHPPVHALLGHRSGEDLLHPHP